MRAAAWILAFFSIAAFGSAETLVGRLIDADCREQHKDLSKPDATCSPGAASSSFGIDTKDGHSYRFDSSGNKHAATLVATSPKTDDLEITVNGTLNGQTVKVESMTVKTIRAE